LTKDGIYAVLAEGPFINQQIHIVWNEQQYSFPTDFVKKVDDYWAHIKEPHIFNGELVRLNEIELDTSSLLLGLSLTNYATLLYSNAHIDLILKTWGRKYLANALGISAVVVTADKKIVLMKRSKNVGEFPDCWDVFGGHIDKPGKGCKPDVYSAMKKELFQELALDESEYFLEFLAVVKAFINQKPEMIFCAFVDKNFDEIENKADRAGYG